MENIALYRKYRPKTFDEVSGQSAIVQTLKNQVISRKIGHAFLFYGLRGSGKTSLARVFAKAVNCNNPVDGNPCLQCEHCTFQNSVNPDIIEIDAASNNGVENVRQLMDEVNYKPTNTKYKVYIIDEVHMLSNSAFNALLKTIEEPPDHAIFILATTELYKVPDTIKSRCQIFTFTNLSIQDITSKLKEILAKESINTFSEDVLEYIAKKSDGSMRDAISILDQSVSYCQTMQSPVTIKDLKKMFGDVDYEITEQLVECLKNSDIIQGLEIIQKQYNDGRNMKSLLNALYEHYFNAFTSGFGTDDGIIFERYARILGETMQEFDRSSHKKVLVELAFIKMCKPDMEKDYNSVVQRMTMLEKELTLLKSGNVNVMSRNVEYQEPEEEIDENVILYYNNYCNNKLIIL